MKVAVSKFFNVNASEKKWYKIVIWWELRRIPFNLILLTLVSISIYTISSMPNDGYFKLIAGPTLAIGFYLSILFYFIGANLLFTLGWIVQIILRQITHKNIRLLIKKLFIIGIVISSIVTLSPIFIWAINLIIGHQA
ncbi:hypothetical protein [Winogradskyella sp.]|uniref:hypothetical protein n=1 Tax=Winogradskyella sp. TaxID=1883156 RepID=UPI003BACF70B